MRKLSSFAICILVAATLSSALVSSAKPSEDSLIVPGSRVGPIQRVTTRRDLDQLKLPDGQLQDGTSEGEGGQSASTQFWAMTPEKRLDILWKDSSMKKIRCVVVTSRPWKTAEGIHVGSSLVELQKLNGGAFSFWKFGFGENSGLVADWKGGKLAKSLTGATIRLTPKVPSYNKLSGPEKESLEKEGSMLSNAPTATRLNPTVESIQVNF